MRCDDCFISGRIAYETRGFHTKATNIEDTTILFFVPVLALVASVAKEDAACMMIRPGEPE